MGREKFGEGHYHCGGVANATINEALKPLYSFFRCFACRPAAFCAVWGGRPKGEPPLANFKLHVTRVRVCVSLAALVGVRCGIGGQPVLEVGVVCANIDQRLCYAIGVFFGCSLRLLTWEKWRFSNRSMPDNAQFVRRAPVGYFRIFTALHRSCSQFYVTLLATRHITVFGLLLFLWRGVEHELYELFDLAGARLSADLKSFVCSCSFSYLRFHTLTSRLSVSTLFFKSPISPREATPSLLGKLPDPLVVFFSALASSYQSYPRSISTAPAPAAS